MSGLFLSAPSQALPQDQDGRAGTMLIVLGLTKSGVSQIM